MSKNLIINKLNKCKAFDFHQSEINKNSNLSKLSTSTKTQESPEIYQLNPQFTFKASDLKKIVPSKSKASQFFDNFNPTQQVIYQKVILTKPKVLERSLEFQLMNLYQQEQKKTQQTAIKKLDFSQQKNTQNNDKPSQKRISAQSLIMKTEYVKPSESSRYTRTQHQQYFDEYIPYDSKKYKLQREKQISCKQLLPKQVKRYHTQTQCQDYEPIPTYISDIYHQTIENHSKPFNDHNFQSLELKGKQQDFFNQYYFKEQVAQQKHQNLQKNFKNSKSMGIQLTKRQGNSSRLSFFRKQRQYQMRKSEVQEYKNVSKSYNFLSKENKQNIKSLGKLIPTISVRNFTQGQKRLGSQLSQRQLLNRNNGCQNLPQKKHSYVIPKSISCLNKETESRIRLIRKQLKQIYQVKDRSRIKIRRDQQVYQQNSRNHLRRVGSICRF